MAAKEILRRSLTMPVKINSMEKRLTTESKMQSAVLSSLSKTECTTLFWQQWMMRVIPRVEMAVRSITGSSRNGPKSIVQNSDWKDFTGNTENTPLRLDSSRLGSYFDQNKKNGTRDFDNSEVSNSPATGLSYDQEAHPYHVVKGLRCHAQHSCEYW